MTGWWWQYSRRTCNLDTSQYKNAVERGRCRADRIDQPTHYIIVLQIRHSSGGSWPYHKISLQRQGNQLQTTLVNTCWNSWIKVQAFASLHSPASYTKKYTLTNPATSELLELHVYLTMQFPGRVVGVCHQDR